MLTEYFVLYSTDVEEMLTEYFVLYNTDVERCWLSTLCYTVQM